MALALMPPDKVLSSFHDIKIDAQCLPGSPLARLLYYFEVNWLSKIELWNVSRFDSRTSNTCEGKEYSLLNKRSFSLLNSRLSQ